MRSSRVKAVTMLVTMYFWSCGGTGEVKNDEFLACVGRGTSEVRIKRHKRFQNRTGQAYTLNPQS